jgi:hypothetical protein
MAKNHSYLANPGIVLLVTYLLLFITNSLVILLANLLAPTHVVLGTAHLSLSWAVCLSMGKLALIGTFMIPIINEAESRRKQVFTPRDWLIVYFIINFIGVWLISRAAGQFGLGISTWITAAILALVFDAAQGMIMMQLEKYRPKL